jgi:uncharacterized protein YkwD
MVRAALTPAVTRRGMLAGALLMAGATAVRAKPTHAPLWFDYNRRLMARLDDAGGGRFELDFARRLLEQTNGFRTNEQLQTYSWDDSLAQCARAHAADMAARNYFAHETPEGFSHLDRVALLTRDMCGQTAENLAWRDYPSAPSTPEQFEVMWETSPSHRRNLLRPDYTSVGYGVVRVRTTYYAAGVYADSSVRLARPLPLRFSAAAQLAPALIGASPTIERLALTPPFQAPTWIARPGEPMPTLQPGTWQLRPLRPTSGDRFDVITGPMFFLS